MRKTLTFSLLLLVALGGACNQKSDTANVDTKETSAATSVASSQVLTPEQLGELGAKIRKTPDRAHELLSEHGLTEQTFESQIRKVTEDPEASKRYAEAYKKAS